MGFKTNIARAERALNVSAERVDAKTAAVTDGFAAVIVRHRAHAMHSLPQCGSTLLHLVPKYVAAPQAGVHLVAPERWADAMRSVGAKAAPKLVVEGDDLGRVQMQYADLVTLFLRSRRPVRLWAIRGDDGRPTVLVAHVARRVWVAIASYRPPGDEGPVVRIDADG